MRSVYSRLEALASCLGLVLSVKDKLGLCAALCVFQQLVVEAACPVHIR